MEQNDLVMQKDMLDITSSCEKKESKNWVCTHGSKAKTGLCFATASKEY